MEEIANSSNYMKGEAGFKISLKVAPLELILPSLMMAILLASVKASS